MSDICDKIPSTEAEKCLGVEPFLQPAARRNPGGDCFACATFAAIRYLRPDAPETFGSTFDRYVCEYEPHPQVTPSPDSPKTYLCNDWVGYGRVLTKLGKDYGISHRYELVLPDYQLDRRSAAWFTGYLISWHLAIVERIEAGAVLMGSIRLASSGQRRDGGLHNTDHAILIDGYRRRWQDHPTVEGSRSLVHEYHVICSAKGPYWITQEDLVWCHGFAAWIAIFPEKTS